MAARVLLASPIPTHPQDQGNSARISALGRALQSAGVTVHFLYYQMEGLSQRQRMAMETCWDHFHSVPCSPINRNPSETGYGLDDWWNPLVADVAIQLHRRWRFQAVIANYVWFSAILDAFDSNVLKVLDTHDVFGGRADRFVAAGLKPEWFYTTPEEEARGLHRADIVLAIQDEEAEHLRGLGHRDVRVVGHILEQRRRGFGRAKTPILTAGYLASGNPINVNSLERLRHRLGRISSRRMRFVVAGSICDKLLNEPTPFEVLGRVDQVDEFYDAVDLVVNPMTFGTGLKIKSVEAVFEGVPLVATRIAMVGLPVRHRFHALASPEEVADCLEGLEYHELADLANASQECASEYYKGVQAAIRNLLASIAQRASAIEAEYEAAAVKLI